MLSNSVVQAKQPHDLVANPPSVVSTVFEKLLDEADPENGTIPQWIEHLIAVYERSPLDTPKGTKAVSVVWRALVQKTPEVSKETIAEINATRRAAMGPEAPPITADDISKGYFIACILRGSITGSRDDKKLDHMIRAALQHLYAETGDIAYAMALTHLAALAVVKSEPAGPVLAETPKAPREQKPRLFPWGRKSPDNVQTKTDSPVLHEATVPSVHQGISFDDLRIRVESIGQGTYDKLPLLGFQQQLTELQLLLTGQPDATQLTKLVRQVSPYTHPDQREQRFPEKSLHGALDTIFKGVTSLVPLVESSDVYEEAGAEEALLQVLQGFSELRKREQQLTINRQERSVQEQHAAFSALPEILEVLKQLQSDVAAIKARLGEGAAAPESNLARGREE
jgi:hypothetical protein